MHSVLEAFLVLGIFRSSLQLVGLSSLGDSIRKLRAPSEL